MKLHGGIVECVYCVNSVCKQTGKNHCQSISLARSKRQIYETPAADDGIHASPNLLSKIDRSRWYYPLGGSLGQKHKMIAPPDPWNLILIRA